MSFSVNDHKHKQVKQDSSDLLSPDVPEQLQLCGDLEQVKALVAIIKAVAIMLDNLNQVVLQNAQMMEFLEQHYPEQ